MAAVAVARVGVAPLSSDARRLVLGAVGALFLGAATIVFLIVTVLQSVFGFATETPSMGLVPPVGSAPVVYLDIGYALRRPFGLNLLDVGQGWSRDQFVENALRVFKHEFDKFWGPRMELVFRMALRLLVDANQRIVAADPTGGRDRQFTVLEVPLVLEDDRLRQRLLAHVADPQIQAMWRTYFNPLDRRFRAEIINPVQTKTYKFAANLTARAIVGPSRSTIDPLSWVRDGAVAVWTWPKNRLARTSQG